MPPPDIPPSMTKPQNWSPYSSRAASISRSVNRLVAHGMISCSGPSKLRVVASPILRTSPASIDSTTSSKICIALPRAFHSASLRSRYRSVTISKIGPTF